MLPSHSGTREGGIRLRPAKCVRTGIGGQGEGATGEAGATGLLRLPRSFPTL